MNATAFWAEAYQVFAEAIEAPAHERHALVESRTEGRPDLRREVLALVEANDASSHFLVVRSAAASTLAKGGPQPIEPGAVVGPWRLIERIGEGGMGQVYRAERADGVYRQRVAVKVTNVSLLDRDATRRFRAERAILASLHHPNIVGLLDGGSLETGQAWLAMNLVDGEPITIAADRRGLGLAGRLRLFRDACAAVHYAHQHGVVHRDIKPPNVLVSRDGVVQVVDFGVAKLLDAGALGIDGVATAASPVPLTPNYASPEQLRGLTVTTSTDVYALGVLLYELVTGTRPYETTGKPLDEVLAIVLDRDPVRPSAATGAGGVPAGRFWPRRGDVDAIVLKAMAKEPDRRHASAAGLALDIERYLDARPVQAREPSLVYVASRLVRRHTVAAGAGVIATLAVMGGLGASLWQARVAERERARAESRLADVRQMANTLIFKVHDAVLPLAGSTPVRHTIVQEALGYLEKLSNEPGEDPALRLELAGAYTRIGQVQGDPQRANLGDRDGAIASFTRAIALVGPLLAHVDPSVRGAAFGASADAEMFLSSVYGSVGRKDDAVAAARRSTSAVEQWAEQNPDDERAQRRLASAYFSVALTLQGAPAIEEWKKSGAIFERLLAGQPDDPDRLRNVALVAKYLGGQYEIAGDRDASMAQYTRALELDERRLAGRPGDPAIQLDVTNDLVSLAAGHVGQARYPEALAMLQRAHAMRRQTADADPHNVLARSKLASVEWRIAETLRRSGDARTALDWTARAIDSLGVLPDPTRYVSTLRDRAAALATRALCHRDLKDRARACEDARRAEADVQAIRQRKAELLWGPLTSDLPPLLASCLQP